MLLCGSDSGGTRLVRLGFGNHGLAALALGVLAGCSGNDVKDLSAKLGCGEVNGLAAITGEKPPAYILVGETIETKEAPAAFAELACQLAARQPKDKPLWVGLPDYIGGTTGAVQAMRRRLSDLVSKGAPIVVGNSMEGSTTGASRREEAERRWAMAIRARVQSASAGRALLLLPRRDGVAVRVIDADGRLEDYTPVALFLPDGQVMNLEIGHANGIGTPTIRIYLKITDGYMGQIALADVTPAQKTAPGNAPD
jgi:hypothetical protein